jgi:hypothetical protein
MWLPFLLYSISASSNQIRLSKDISLSTGVSSNLLLTLEPKILYSFQGLAIFSSSTPSDFQISFLPFRNCEETKIPECKSLVFSSGLFTIITSQTISSDYFSSDLKWKFIDIETSESAPVHKNSYKRAQTTDRDNGSISFDSNMNLKWVINGDSVTFSLYVKKSFGVDSKYGGFGPKDYSSKGNMNNADMIVFYLYETNVCFDMWSDRNEAPYEDDSNDITCEDRVDDGTYYVYKATRKLDTGDSLDFSFKDLTQVKFIWAWGDVYSGQMEEHPHNGAGSVSVTLTTSSESSTTESSTTQSSTTESSTTQSSTTESSSTQSSSASQSSTTQSSSTTESTSESTSTSTTTNQSSFGLSLQFISWSFALLGLLYL